MQEVADLSQELEGMAEHLYSGLNRSDQERTEPDQAHQVARREDQGLSPGRNPLLIEGRRRVVGVVHRRSRLGSSRR